MLAIYTLPTLYLLLCLTEKLSFGSLLFAPNDHSFRTLSRRLMERHVAHTRGPFLKRPGNLTGPKSYFEIKGSRKVRCVLTSNEAHFVSLADNFTLQFSNLLKLPSGVENKTA